MISTSNITLRVGKKALFEDVNIKFTEGNCYGLQRCQHGALIPILFFRILIITKQKTITIRIILNFFITLII